MARMEMSKQVWTFVVALAAVVNGMGIVRLIGGAAEYLKNRQRLDVTHYWPYSLMVLFQLMAHALLWWSVLGLKAASGLNFLSYLYLILGPTLLFIATSLLIPSSSDSRIDLRAEYFMHRSSYYSTLSLFWLWAIFLWPVFGYSFAPTVPLILVWLGISIASRVTASPMAHSILVVGNCMVFVYFVVRFAMELGTVGKIMTG